MKSGCTKRPRGGRKSLPVRGAWIEISFAEMLTSEKKSRSPCGERGLKYELKEKLCEELQGRSPCGERGLKCRHLALVRRQPLRRSPCGERGLKSICQRVSGW